MTAIDSVVKYEKLDFKSANELKRAFDAGVRFVLFYHEDLLPVTHMRLHEDTNSVWVSNGKMLPVHIRPDGTSKDGTTKFNDGNPYDGMRIFLCMEDENERV